MSVLTEEQQAVDLDKANQFAGQLVADLSANYSGVMALIGQELGLYKAMRGAGPLTSLQLAQKSKLFERYVREWLNSQAAGGYVIYYPESKTYELPEEHALVLVEQDSPFLLAPAYYVVHSLWKDQERLQQAFRTGEGIGWHEHHPHLYYGIEVGYRTGYLANLNQTWIPSLEGVEEKLRKGGRVADIGCGHGASTLIMAEKFPHSIFYGFDYHQESILKAEQRAEEKGLSNAFFQVADAEGYGAGNFDLICFFDCLHDFGNPLEALRYAKTKLAQGGSLLLVEPNAGNRPEDNFHPIGRLYYSASTALCVPHAQFENGGFTLGAQAGPAATEKVVKEAGFSQFRIAHQNLINIIYEVKL